MRSTGTWFVMVGLMGLITATGAFAQGRGEAAANTAQPPGPRDGGRQGGRGFGAQGWVQEMAVARIVNDSKVASEIGLSEEQLKTLKDAAEQFKSKREELQKQLLELGNQQVKLMEEAVVDETAVLATMDKASPIRLELDKARIKNLLVIKKTLTPEQSNKITVMVEEQRRAHAGDARRAPEATEKPAETPPAPPAK